MKKCVLCNKKIRFKLRNTRNTRKIQPLINANVISQKKLKKLYFSDFQSPKYKIKRIEKFSGEIANISTKGALAIIKIDDNLSSIEEIDNGTEVWMTFRIPDLSNSKRLQDGQNKQNFYISTA